MNKINIKQPIQIIIKTLLIINDIKNMSIFVISVLYQQIIFVFYKKL